jgi:hypothetical protein
LIDVNKNDAESVTEQSPGQRPGTAVSSIHHPEAMDINNVPVVIEGWRSWPCMDKQDVD